MSNVKKLQADLDAANEIIAKYRDRDRIDEDNRKIAAHKAKLTNIGNGLIPVAELRGMVRSIDRDYLNNTVRIDIVRAGVYADRQKFEIETAIVKAVSA